MSKLIQFEDEHLLLVNKPAGMNTHAPSPFAGEGIFDWLRHREPRWTKLAILHRLDKETSGLLLFGKTPEANRSLTRQFTEHEIRKTYLLLTDRPVTQKESTVTSVLVRAGEKYLSRPIHAGGDQATTHFRLLRTEHGRSLLQAEPLTGRTHQIRVHAASLGFPILGDTLYGGSPAPRVCLHAASLTLRHPATDQEMTFQALAEFEADSRFALRDAVIDSEQTDAYRLIHGASDGWPGWYVDRLGEFLLSQSEEPLSTAQQQCLAKYLAPTEALGMHSETEAKLPTGAYHKTLQRRIRGASAVESSPQHLLGAVAPERFIVRENGVSFELSFSEGYSVGLFLDQRDNRRRLLCNHLAAEFPLFDDGTPEMLNAFAYTCGFSVCAAKAGVRTTNLDLSRKYLEWGRRNFALNQIDSGAHDFIYGDVFDWLRRLQKKQRRFDIIVLDPPTFSKSKEWGVFRAEADYERLVSAALPLLRKNGVLLASTNAARMEPEAFLKAVRKATQAANRKILREHYVPQPPDFPITRAEPAYLKTVWLRVA